MILKLYEIPRDPSIDIISEVTTSGSLTELLNKVRETKKIEDKEKILRDLVDKCQQ